MRPQILDKTKKKKIIENLKIFGIEKIPYLLIKTGKEKIRAYSGSLSKEELTNLSLVVPVLEIGMYFGKEVIEGKTKIRNTRINLDAVHLLQKQIKKNIIELNKEQEKEWFFGRDVELGQEVRDIHGGSFVILKSKEDFIGVGRLSVDCRIISNYLPKERRRRES